MKTLLFPLPHRFDFLEFAGADLAAIQKTLESLGFVATQIRQADQLDQKLLVRGRVRVLLSREDGSKVSLRAVGYHVDSAKKAVNVLPPKKTVVLQPFGTDEDEIMFLQSAVIEGPAGIRVVLVTRSGAPHDVLAPFAPHFQKTPAAKGFDGGKSLSFVSISDPENGVVEVKFKSAEAQEWVEVLDDDAKPIVRLCFEV